MQPLHHTIRTPNNNTLRHHTCTVLALLAVLTVILLAAGTANILAAMDRHMSKQQRNIKEILVMRSDKDLQAWERLDDVIMGGSSSSGLAVAEDGGGVTWKGDLIVEVMVYNIGMLQDSGYRV